MNGWNLGQPTTTPLKFAARKHGTHPELHEPREYFTVIQHENGVRIQATRTRDLAVFTVEAIDFDYVDATDTADAFLKSRGSGRGKVRIVLPPQHLAEQAHEAKTPPTQLAGHSLSRTSVLAFDVSTGANWRPKISLAELLDWRTLDLRVHDRAQEDLAGDVLAQLTVAFGNEPLSDLEYDRAIALIDAKLTGPGPDETALDLSGSLVFSPSDTAGWNHPKAPDWYAPAVPLWSLAADGHGSRRMRVIHSRLLGEGFPDLPTDNQRPTFEPRQTLTKRMQWDIVAQTSVPGIPALRRLEAADGAGSEDGDKPEVPRSGVVRPAGVEIEFLKQIDDQRGFENEDSGIALATPFEHAALRMTALGATFEGLWKGKPARVFHTLDPNADYVPGTLPAGFDLERLQINSWLGRDMEIVAVEKGFLFPLGILASLVTVNERRMFTIGDQQYSYLYRRQFISCSNEPRSYPGPYQPHEGRQFPPRTVTMRTLVTPTLQPPQNIEWKKGKEWGLKLENEAIFWPRVTDQAGKNPKDFVFEWSTEDAPRIRSNLLFVKNKEVGREPVMAALVEYYEKELKAPGLRLAWLDGARHSYAPAGNRPGSTSFDTVYWQLGAEGRLNEKATDPQNRYFYRMDGLMEGADQPPFYPVMRKAEIAIQSLNQMMATPKGTTEVAYYDGYVEKGIDNQIANPAEGKSSPEIFLQIETPIKFDPSSKPNRSGGIASPDVNIAALSRSTGLVGGSVPKNPAEAAATGKLNFSSAAEGSFDVKQFFDGAELLGLFSFSDLVDMAGSALDAAPQMIEQVEEGARETLATVRQLARELLDYLYGSRGLMKEVKAAIDGLTIDSGNMQIGLKELYPKLDKALRPFLDEDASHQIPVEHQLRVLVGAGDEGTARDAIIFLSAAIKDAAAELRQVARDPVPKAFVDQIKEVADRIQDSVNQARNFVRTSAEEFAKQLVGALKQSLCDAITRQGYGRILFGRNVADCNALFSRPARMLEMAGNGLLASGLEQLFKAASPFLARGVALQLQLAWEVERVKEAAIDALQDATAAINHRLQPYTNQTNDIRNQKRLDEFAAAIERELADFLKVSASSVRLEPKEALRTVRLRTQDLRDKFDDRINTHLLALRSGIRPLDPSELDKVHKRLIASLLASLRARVADPIEAELRRMAEQLGKELQSEAGFQIRAVEENLVALLETLVASKELAAIARVGEQVAGMCDAATDAAKSAFDGLLGDAATVTAKVGDFAAKVRALRIPDDPQFDKAQRARGQLLAIADRIVAAEAEMKALRGKLVGQTGRICDAPQLWLERATDISQRKRRIAEELWQAAGAIGILQKQSLPATAIDNNQLLDEAVRLAADIQLQVTGIAAMTDPANLGRLEAAIAKIGEAQGLEAFARQVRDAFSEAQRQARELAAKIAVIGTDAAKLRTVSEKIANEYIRAFDQDLAGSLLQTVAFPKALVDHIESELSKPVEALKKLAAPFYDSAARASQTFVQPVLDFGQITSGQQPDPLLAAIYRFALGVKDANEFRTKFVQPIKTAEGQLPTEKETILALTVKSSAKDLKAVLALFRDTNGTPPTSQLLKLFSGIRALARFESGETLVAHLRELLASLEKRLRELVTQFVPTKLTTSYDWGAKLREFPSPDWIFNPGTANAKGHHLTIKSTFSFDVVTQKNEVLITGELEPCTIWLLGKNLDMIQIHLGKTTFKSVNGDKPDFDVDITSVTVGVYLSYIQALQDWLAPKGSGFYIIPTTDFVGIEAGYRFSTALIQVGNLQFIDVSFTAAVELPFTKTEKGAIFKLGLGGPGRPFLVAAPPYGGGGWVVLKAWRKKGSSKIAVGAFDASIVFGGVSAIRFGPLRANGSILAGIRVKGTGDGTYQFQALFHAVGEGSVACFSVCVSLRVTLTQHRGALFGQAEYSFSFKVGFFKYKYKVTARYKQNDSKKSRSPELVEGKTRLYLTDPGWWRTDAPRKGKDWNEYQKHMDLKVVEGFA